MSQLESLQNIPGDPRAENITEAVKNLFSRQNKETNVKPNASKRIDLNQKDHENLVFQDEAEILIFDNCLTIQHFLQAVNEEKCRNFLKKSSHCFVIIANIVKTGLIDLDDFVLHFETFDLLSRPLLVQMNIEAMKTAKIFIKPECKNELQSFNFEDKITKKDFDSVESRFDIDSVLKMLSSNIAGKFDGDILSCRFDLKKSFNGLHLIDCAVKADEAFAVRFLKLFGVNEIEKSSLELAAKHGSPKTFCALFGLPITNDGREFRLNEATRRKMLDEQLLCIAAKCGKPETVDFLIRLEIFSSIDAMKASNCAVDGKKFENLLTLLRKDFPWPDKFSQNLVASSDGTKQTDVIYQKLKKLYEERNDFHKALIEVDAKLVEKFVEENPEIRIGYSERNETALRVALQGALRNENFKVYALLLYHRFTVIDDVEYQSLNRNLSDKQRKEITLACQSFYGRPVDSHIFFIYSKTRLGLGYDVEVQKLHFESIKGFLDTLNQIPEIVTILKVVENSSSLMIVFDFDRDNVHKIDLLSSDRTMGICYLNSGHLYVGAKTSDAEVISTLIHELTHYAMKILFDNDAQPFYADDFASKQRFEEIVDECKKIESNVPIVRRVFTAGYAPARQNAELIVRVPEMIAFYYQNPKQLQKHLETYSNLVDFYKEKVVAEVEDFIKDSSNFQSFRDVQQLNDRLGNLREISKIKIQPSDFNDVDKNISKLKIIVSDIPKFTMANLVQSLRKRKKLRVINSSVIVLSSKDLNNEVVVHNLIATCLTTSNINLIIQCESFANVNDETWKLFLEENSFCGVYFVCEEDSIAQAIKIKLADPNITHSEFYYKWIDLPQEMQAELLRTKFFFQNHEIELGEIVKPNAESAKALPIAKLLKKDFREIGKPIQSSNGYDLKYFIQRTLKQNKPLASTENFANFLMQSESQKVMLLADVAGMGKSTILTHVAIHLKEKFPDHWVIRTELHKHADMFGGEKRFTIENLLGEFLENSGNEFEARLLNELLSEGKVILLLDGLDEISPYFENQFVSFLKMIKSSKVKQIWITMRPHLRENFEENVGTAAWELTPFTKENQIVFLTKYWSNRFKKFELSDDMELKLAHFAEELIKQLLASIEDNSFKFVGVPLQARMIADIFFEEVKRNLKVGTLNFKLPESFDLLWLYKEFMIRKIMITSSEKGEVVGTEKARNEVEGVAIMEIHGKFAVAKTFTDKNIRGYLESELEKLELDSILYEIEVSNDELQRYGLITVDSSGRAYFIHRTFAEYFIATFVYGIISRPKMFPIQEGVKLMALLGSRLNELALTFLEMSIRKSRKVQQDTKVQTQIAKCIEDELKLTKFWFLTSYVVSSKTYSANFLLNCVGFCSNEMIKMILCYKKFESILHMAAWKGNKGIIDHIWRLAEGCMDAQELRNYFFMRIAFMPLNAFRIMFHKLFFNRSTLMDECFSFEQMRDRSLTCNDIDYDFYAENSSLTKLYRIAKEFLDENELNILAHRKSELFIYQRHFGNESAGFRPPLKSDFSCRYFRYILDLRWSIVKDMSILKIDDSLMMEENWFTDFIPVTLDQTGRNDGDGHILELFKWLSEKFPTREVMKHCVERFFIPSFQKLKSFETAREILKIVKLYLTDDEFADDFLLHGETFFACNDYWIFDLLKIAEEVFSKRELRNLIMNTHEDGFTKNLIFNLLMINYRSVELLRFTFDIIANNFSTAEALTMFKQLIFEGLLLVDFVVKTSTAEKFQTLLDFFRIFDEKDQREFMTKDVLRSCVEKQDEEMLQLLLNYIEKIHGNDEIVEFLVHQNSEGRSTIDCMKSLKDNERSDMLRRFVMKYMTVE